MLRDSIIAAIRTGVAALVTWLLAWVLQIGVHIDPNTSHVLNVLLFGLAIAGYNFVVGLLERKVNPLFGLLLGVPKAPAYGEVGTQTPPPADPLIGHPRNDRGYANAFFAVGVVVLVVGLLLWLFTVYTIAGIILTVVGAILLIAAVVAGRGPGRTTRLR